jgi:hypothetical protein
MANNEVCPYQGGVGLTDPPTNGRAAGGRVAECVQNACRIKENSSRVAGKGGAEP